VGVAMTEEDGVIPQPEAVRRPGDTFNERTVSEVRDVTRGGWVFSSFGGVDTGLRQLYPTNHDISVDNPKATQTSQTLDPEPSVSVARRWRWISRRGPRRDR
jgi:hypothetical protein